MIYARSLVIPACALGVRGDLLSFITVMVPHIFLTVMRCTARWACWLAFCSVCWLQAGPIDSLQWQLSQVETDSQRMALHIELGFAHWDEGHLAKARRHFRQALSLADQSAPPLGRGQARRYLGMLLAAEGRHDSARQYHLAADHWLGQAGDAREWMKLKIDLGNAHYYLADYEPALRAYQQADSLAAQVGQLHLERAIILGNIGGVYLELDRPQQALRYHARAVAMARASSNPSRLGTALHNLGAAYEQVDSLSQAHRYLSEALAIAEGLGDDRIRGYCYHALSSLSRKEGDLDAALLYAQQAFALAGSPVEEVLYRSRWGYYLSLRDRSPQAEKLLRQALAQSEAQGLTEYSLEIIRFLQEHHYRRGEMAKAYAWLDRHQRLNDSIRSQAVLAKVRDLEVKYETEQKEKENLRLKAQNQAQAARLRWQRTALAFSLLLLGFGGLVFYFYQKNQQARRRLAEQTTTLQAQRIQQMEKEHQLTSMQAMVDGQEAERSRLARDLHDGLGGLLSTVRLQLSRMREGGDALPAREEFLQAQALIDKASTELRRIAHNLMPQVLVRFGLQAALEDLVSDLKTEQGPAVELQVYGWQEPLAPGYALSLYRMAQELINNVLKHAQASEVLVQVLRRDRRIYLTVEDNGRGFDPQAIRTGGHGLANLRSRAAYLQGTLEIDTRPGQGTTVYLTFDLKSPSHDSTDDR